MLDYLIVGQGLAGSILAYELHSRGKKVHVLADDALPTSSRVAGGMFNPVTGKHLAKTWLANELFSYLIPYYEELERKFGKKFFHQTGLYRPFVNENQRQQFLNLFEKHQLQDYLEVVSEMPQYADIVNSELGGMFTKKAGWIDVPELLNSFKNYFISENLLSSESVDYKGIDIHANFIIYKNYSAEKIIFCEGFYVKNNPYFSWLPMSPVKGETLLISTEKLPIHSIINQGKWVLPVRPDFYRVGATYSWHSLDFLPTPEARLQLEEALKKFFKPTYAVVDQWAGVRPATLDRRPFLGLHPQFNSLGIFNGLGTKGVSIAPYFAHHFADFLCDGKEIHPDTTIERYYSLF